MQFACLFFGADDSVCFADTISATVKSDAVGQATTMMGTLPGAIGFQIWRDGAMVAEHFIEARGVGGTRRPFRPRVNNTM